MLLHAAKQEPAATTVAPITIVVSVAPSTAAISVTASVAPLAAPHALVVFKQLQQHGTYNGSTSELTLRGNARLNGWTTAQDKAQNLTLFLEGPAADVHKDVDVLAPTAYEDIWKQLGRRCGYTDAPRDAMGRFDSRRQQDNESLQEFEQALHLLHRKALPTKTPEQRDWVQT